MKQVIYSDMLTWAYWGLCGRKEHCLNTAGVVCSRTAAMNERAPCSSKMPVRTKPYYEVWDLESLPLCRQEVVFDQGKKGTLLPDTCYCNHAARFDQYCSCSTDLTETMRLKWSFKMKDMVNALLHEGAKLWSLECMQSYIPKELWKDVSSPWKERAESSNSVSLWLFLGCWEERQNCLLTPWWNLYVVTQKWKRVTKNVLHKLSLCFSNLPRNLHRALRHRTPALLFTPLVWCETGQHFGTADWSLQKQK